MNDTELLKSVEAEKNPEIPNLFPGDSVSVHYKIKEGDRERIQEFKGIVLYTRGSGNNASFTVRRIAKVVVERHNKVRRARLYYLRERTGKSARLKQRF